MDILVSQILTHKIMTDNIISANFMSVKNRNNSFSDSTIIITTDCLGLLATSGEARLRRGGRERIANGAPQGEDDINEYLSKVRHRVYVLASK